MAKNTGKNTTNLKPAWKEGDPSPNPNGRPKGQRNYATIYREALIKLATKNGMEAEDLETELLEKAILTARKGDYRFYKDLIDRLYGTPVTRSELTGKDGGVIQIAGVEINVRK